MDNHIQIAQTIIKSIPYITLATASKDGTPWNSPVYAASDESMNFYWSSYPASQHSQNIAENPHAFLVIYDSTGSDGTSKGVYIPTTATMLEDEAEIRTALTTLNTRIGKERFPTYEIYMASPQRIYKATPKSMWMNGAEKDENGRFIRDFRIEIDIQDFIAP
jgi:general stress protein 26